MNKVYLTGDIHGKIDMRFVDTSFADEGDTLIILGDTGILWNSREPGKIVRIDRYLIDRLENVWPGDIAFIDGNHDNYPAITSMPLVDYKGSYAHKITDKIFHLQRGEIYNFSGYGDVLTLGVAWPINASRRTPTVDWWKEEIHH